MATVPALADMIGNNFGGGMITNLVAFLIITTIVEEDEKSAQLDSNFDNQLDYAINLLTI